MGMQLLELFCGGSGTFAVGEVAQCRLRTSEAGARKRNPELSRNSFKLRGFWRRGSESNRRIKVLQTLH